MLAHGAAIGYSHALTLSDQVTSFFFLFLLYLIYYLSEGCLKPFYTIYINCFVFASFFFVCVCGCVSVH